MAEQTRIQKINHVATGQWEAGVPLLPMPHDEKKARKQVNITANLHALASRVAELTDDTITGVMERAVRQFATLKTDARPNGTLQPSQSGDTIARAASRLYPEHEVDTFVAQTHAVRLGAEIAAGILDTSHNGKNLLNHLIDKASDNNASLADTVVKRLKLAEAVLDRLPDATPETMEEILGGSFAKKVGKSSQRDVKPGGLGLKQ